MWQCTVYLAVFTPNSMYVTVFENNFANLNKQNDY